MHGKRKGKCDEGKTRGKRERREEGKIRKGWRKYVRENKEGKGRQGGRKSVGGEEKGEFDKGETIGKEEGVTKGN